VLYTNIGNSGNEIDIACYQMSNAAMSMTRDKIIEPCEDANLMRVKSTSNEQYIPDVFFKYKNEYGLEVTKTACPTFPVEYLIITVRFVNADEPFVSHRSKSTF
jgi:nuclear protein localization family protein 4